MDPSIDLKSSPETYYLFTYMKGALPSQFRMAPNPQERFVSTMQTIVSKKQKIKVKKEEGWYSETDLKTLGWNPYEPQQLSENYWLELEQIWKDNLLWLYCLAQLVMTILFSTRL